MKTRKDNIIEDYHGTKVADPYRWLEDPFSDESKQWMEAQNKQTFDFIRSHPEKGRIKARLKEIINFEKYTVPVKRNNRYFFFKNDGLQNQPVAYMMEGLNGEPKVVIDPNKLSEDGTTSIGSWSFNEDGSYMAVALSKSGSDNQEVHVLETDTGKMLDDTIKWCRFTSLPWKKDGSGFFYSRYPKPGTVPDEDLGNYCKVYFHKLGTKQEDDELIYERPDDKELGFHPIVSEDGRFLLIYVYHGTDNENRFYYMDLEKGDGIVKFLDKADAAYEFIGNDGNTFYFNTNLDSPKYKVIAIDINRPERENWLDIVPESDDTIEFGVIINGHLLLAYLHNAYNVIKMYDLNGYFVKELELPDMGSINGISGKEKGDNEMFIQFSSFLYPAEVFRYDFEKGEFESFFKPNIKIDISQYEVEQQFYESKDGTKVPMFIIHHKDIKLNGDNPTILYGYGGFNVSLKPYFSIHPLSWLELGGVYAIANLRGGGEFGEDWHRAGMLENKQNVFDDFISAGEYLISKGFTSKDKLSIMGGSNGGLLVAACMVQRPDLYGAVICRVPVIDMLRFHKFTIGRYWTGEYGNAEKNPQHFRFMYAYSPLHNVKEGINYPPTLICSADTDDRVVPSHAKKFAATLQEKQSEGGNPILIRLETKAGHGHGKPTHKIIEEESDIFTFLIKVFNKGF
jgi:prolyl oligopeptidase